MRHLKKFESTSSELDVEYIKECFVEFIDNGAEVEVDELPDGRPYIEFIINLPGVKYRDGRYFLFHKMSGKFNMQEKINYFTSIVEHYKNIELCIEKVKIHIENVIVEAHNESEFEADEEFEAYTLISFTMPKVKVTKDLPKGKLNFIKSSELKDSWI